MACEKLKHYTEEDTWHNINRLINSGKIENRNYEVYYCDKCEAYHFGTINHFTSYGTAGLKKKARLSNN